MEIFFMVVILVLIFGGIALKVTIDMMLGKTDNTAHDRHEIAHNNYMADYYEKKGNTFMSSAYKAHADDARANLLANKINHRE